jgi:GH24 family phage-related lysozyme (muramidase)
MFIGVWEGGKLRDGSSVVYADRLAQGLPTVCGGLTRHITTTPIVEGERWPAEKCLTEEQKAITKVQITLERCFEVQPPQSVFDAATSHAWNFGAGATCGSLAMKAWNAEQWALGCRRLATSDGGKPVWSYVKGLDGKPKFVRGLANRRQAEVLFCMEDVQ